MNIAVVGTGYVGLVTGTCFAETGNLEDAIKDAEIVFLALPTPPGEDGSADLSYIMGVARDLSHIIKDYKVIIDKSTVPVGTSEAVHGELAKNLSEDMFDVVSNPEFLREGVAVDDFMKPDRVVIGTSSAKAKAVMQQLYDPFVRQGNPIIFMDERSAEMTKYAANSYLATRISYMNEIANLCEAVSANVDMVRMGMGSDSRIGKRFLFPGVGYGGSCFPKDVQALAKTAGEYNYDFKILKSVMQVNKKQKTILSQKIINYFGGDLSGRTIAVWGLAFKPNTDDIREAPALYIMDELIEAGAKIKAFDPEAMENIKEMYGDKLTYAENQYDAVEGADALAIITEWSVFRTPDFDKVVTALGNRAIFDGRNLYDLHKMKSLDIHYESIGRNPILMRAYSA